MNLEHLFMFIKEQVRQADLLACAQNLIPFFLSAGGISGNLYVSDSSGSRFALSLSNHLVRIFDGLF